MWVSISMKEDQQTTLENNVDESEEIHFEKQTRCGIWGCYPSFIQPLASKKTYIVVFGLLGMINFAMGAYTVAILSTLEKRFNIPSRTSGLITCFWDIGTILSSVSMAYIGGQGHKTRWVSLGMFIASIASFAQLLPHIIYGPGEDAIAIAFISNQTSANKTVDSLSICGLGSLQEEKCSEDSLTTMPGNILMMSNFVMGVGTCMYWTLGVAYMDDNVKKNKVAWLLSIVMFLRMLGPTMGSLLASYSLQLYIDPSLTPKITSRDPRWIGAWWFGWIIFGFIIMIFASVFALFPRQLPRAAEREKRTLNKLCDNDPGITKKSIRDFYGALKRLMKNRILMYNSLSSVFYLFGFMAYWTFLPKYIETQFRLSASEASLITGSVAFVCTAMGVMVSGAFISKFKPSPRSLAAWNVFVEIMDVVGGICFSFIDCPKEALHGSWNNDGTWNLFNDCNSACGCGPDVKYEPICSLDRTMTYYSPCHAGCTNTSIINGTKINLLKNKGIPHSLDFFVGYLNDKVYPNNPRMPLKSIMPRNICLRFDLRKMFTNCSCIPESGMATESFCPANCKNSFFIFVAILCAVNFFGATGRAGNTIIQFRSVSPKDKSLSIGFSEMLFSAFAFIPAPIFYGLLLDYTCLVWGHVCGETGNCWLYSDQSLRYFLNFTSSGFIMVAVLFDCGVWYSVKGLEIYDEKTKEEIIDFKKVNSEENDKHLLTELMKPTDSSNLDS